MTMLSVATEELHSADRPARTVSLFEQVSCSESADERSELLEQVVLLHVDVARSMARRYRDRGVALEDLEQVACLALTKAVQRFDAERAAVPGSYGAFMGFAVPTIRGELRRYFRDHGWVVRPARWIQELQPRIVDVVETAWVELGRSLTPSEIATRLEVPEDDVIEALAAEGCFSPASLDRPVTSTGEVVLGDLLPDQDRDTAAAEARVLLKDALGRLGDRDRLILRLRYYEGLTQREVGEEIGVTQMQVSRLLARIEHDVRQQIGETDEQNLSDADGDVPSTV